MKLPLFVLYPAIAWTSTKFYGQTGKHVGYGVGREAIFKYDDKTTTRKRYFKLLQPIFILFCLPSSLWQRLWYVVCAPDRT